MIVITRMVSCPPRGVRGRHGGVWKRHQEDNPGNQHDDVFDRRGNHNAFLGALVDYSVHDPGDDPRDHDRLDASA